MANKKKNKKVKKNAKKVAKKTESKVSNFTLNGHLLGWNPNESNHTDTIQDRKELVIDEDSRIYAIVADVANTDPKQLTSLRINSSFSMSVGKKAAQAAHAVSKLKLQVVDNHGCDQFTLETMMEPITTIVLSARNSDELRHIEELLCREGLEYADFYDDNDKVYGEGVKVLTAVAVGPVKKYQVDGIIDYLPLMG